MNESGPALRGAADSSLEYMETVELLHTHGWQKVAPGSKGSMVQREQISGWQNQPILNPEMRVLRNPDRRRFCGLEESKWTVPG